MRHGCRARDYTAPDGSIITSGSGDDDQTPSPLEDDASTSGSGEGDVITHGDDTKLLGDDLINNDKWEDDLTFDGQQRRFVAMRDHTNQRQLQERRC